MFYVREGGYWCKIFSESWWDGHSYATFLRKFNLDTCLFTLYWGLFSAIPAEKAGGYCLRLLLPLLPKELGTPYKVVKGCLNLFYISKFWSNPKAVAKWNAVDTLYYLFWQCPIVFSFLLSVEKKLSEP